ncbi:MAG: response regulator [Candidatus Aureabacteria bacterium]|nr:response regulator [Candidatus Auribacterota bacterium]
MKKTILFADDDDVFRFTISEYFSSHPSLVFELAENGVIALDKALAKQYDLILMDINMPFMKGNEAVKLIRSKWPTCKIYAFTGYTSDDKVNEFLNDGFNGIINKPIELKLLEGKLADILTSQIIIPCETAAPPAHQAEPPAQIKPAEKIPLQTTPKPLQPLSRPSKPVQPLVQSSKTVSAPAEQPVFHKTQAEQPPAAPPSVEKVMTGLDAATLGGSGPKTEKIEIPASVLIKRIKQLEKEKEDLLKEIAALKSAFSNMQTDESKPIPPKNGDENIATFEIE